MFNEMIESRQIATFEASRAVFEVKRNAEPVLENFSKEKAWLLKPSPGIVGSHIIGSRHLLNEFQNALLVAVDAVTPLWRQCLGKILGFAMRKITAWKNPHR